MPTFKVKELMIHVLPREQEEFGECIDTTTRDCAVISHCVDVTFVGCGVSACRLSEQLKGCDGGVCTACTTDSASPCRSVSCKSPALQLEHLAALRADLHRNLSRLEAEERYLEEELRPRTSGDVTQLERTLTGALEDLRTQNPLREDPPRPSE